MNAAGLGKLVRERREKLYPGKGGLKMCAAAIGLSPSHLSQIEKGKIALPTHADTRRRIARALNLRHVDLFVAAGELLPDEIAPCPPQGGDSWRAEVDDALHDVIPSEGRLGQLRFLGVLWRSEDRKAAETETEP